MAQVERLHLKEDIVPVATLQANSSRLLRELREAEAELESGRGIPQEELEQDFERQWGQPLTP